jgi:hypothetical protein
VDFAETREDKVLEEFASNASCANHQYSSLHIFVSSELHLPSESFHGVTQLLGQSERTGKMPGTSWPKYRSTQDLKSSKLCAKDNGKCAAQKNRLTSFTIVFKGTPSDRRLNWSRRMVDAIESGGDSARKLNMYGQGRKGRDGD